MSPIILFIYGEFEFRIKLTVKVTLIVLILEFEYGFQGHKDSGSAGYLFGSPASSGISARLGSTVVVSASDSPHPPTNGVRARPHVDERGGSAGLQVDGAGALGVSLTLQVNKSLGPREHGLTHRPYGHPQCVRV